MTYLLVWKPERFYLVLKLQAMDRCLTSIAYLMSYLQCLKGVWWNVVKFEYIRGKEINNPEDFEDCTSIHLEDELSGFDTDVVNRTRTQQFIDDAHEHGYKIYQRLKKEIPPVFNPVIDSRLEDVLGDYATAVSLDLVVDTNSYLKRIKEVLGL